MSTAHYQRELKSMAKGMGYEIEDSNGGHIKLVHGKTGSMVFAPATPRQPERTLKNMRAYMRKGAAAVVKVVRENSTTKTGGKQLAAAM